MVIRKSRQPRVRLNFYGERKGARFIFPLSCVLSFFPLLSSRIFDPLVSHEISDYDRRIFYEVARSNIEKAGEREFSSSFFIFSLLFCSDFLRERELDRFREFVTQVMGDSWFRSHRSIPRNFRKMNLTLATCPRNWSIVSKLHLSTLDFISLSRNFGSFSSSILFSSDFILE